MTLADGQVVYADIIIGADGARSIVRPVVVEDDTPEAPSQMTIYTGTIPIATMETDPDMRSIVHDIGHPHWLGNGCLAMSTYLVFFSRLLGSCTASNFEMLTKVLLRLRSISHSASTSYLPFSYLFTDLPFAIQRSGKEYTASFWTPEPIPKGAPQGWDTPVSSASLKYAKIEPR